MDATSTMDDNDAARPPIPRRPGLIALALQPSALRAAVRVALVVGTVLNLVNNGPAWWAGESVAVWKVLMNFAVPLCVSGYSAARNEAKRHRGP
jgi:hypothetical protein